MKNYKLKIGIIGCGGIALTKHIPALIKLGEVEISSIFDTSKECIFKAVKDFGLNKSRICSTIDEILDDKSIDAVNICVPNKYHADLTIRSLEAGKHVMCEKPMALNSNDAKKMLHTSIRAGKKLTVSCQNRFRADLQFLKNLCIRGDLGDIYFAIAYAIRRRGVPVWLLDNKEDQGGGPLIDIGTHALDLTLWLMDNFKPRSVIGNVYHKLNSRKNEANLWGSWDPEKFKVEDSAFGFITMKNGSTIILESSWALNILQESDATATLCGTEGGADMNYKFGQFTDLLRINGSDSGNLCSEEFKFENTNNEFYKGAGLEAKSWIDCIINDTDPVVRPEEEIVVVEILEAISRSAIDGKPVYFK